MRDGGGINYISIPLLCLHPGLHACTHGGVEIEIGPAVNSRHISGLSVW